MNGPTTPHNSGHVRRLRYCLVAMLMYGPATIEELVRSSGLDECTVRQNLKDMQEAGIAYVAGLRRPRRPNGRRGRGARVYALQQRPYMQRNSSQLLPNLEEAHEHIHD